jgi:hypothetical protein
MTAEQLRSMGCPPPLDPATLPEELALPLPCDRRLVMRRVPVPSRHLLDHQEVHLGLPEETDDARSRVLSGPHRAFIAGTLTRPGQEERYFYIGKYEISDLQMMLFRERAFDTTGADLASRCARVAAEAQKIPFTQVTAGAGITWFEAIAFADTVTRWLIRQDQERIRRRQPATALPWVEAVPAFLRLPTEVEWEYAARGAIATAAAQAERLPRILRNGAQVEPDVQDVASLTTAQNRPPQGRQVHALGRRQPNLLGLYDVVGNAEEMTIDLFRPVRPDGLSGMPGGYVTRGGGAQDPADNVGVATRREAPFYRIDGAAAGSTVGFRLVLSGPILVNRRNEDFEEMAGNPGLADAIRVSWSQLADAAGAGAAARQELAETLARLQEANSRGDVDRSNLAAQVASLQASLARGNAELNERDRRIARQLVENQIGLGLGVNSVYRRIQTAPALLLPLEARLRYGRFADGSPVSPADRQRDQDTIARFGAEVERLERTNRRNFDAYVESMSNLAREQALAIDAAMRDLRGVTSRQGDVDFERMVRVLGRQLTEARRTGGQADTARKAQWQAQLERLFPEQ